MRSLLMRWLDLRPDEVRPVALSFAGAFLAIGFLILARSLREALYLTSFPVETLPYITAAVALLSVPTVGLFARLLAGGRPQRVLMGTVVALALGVGLLWPLVTASGVAVVVFYLWTALGTLLLTSGFWLITAELFPVRGAKRLFGLIGAGGTAGAMIIGNALALLSEDLGIATLVPGLILVLVLFLSVQLALPRVDAEPASGAPRPSMREGFELAWRTPHLRTIGLIVAVATVASTLVDYQFKELARASLDTGERLAGFFGAFYGWTGAASLVIQLFVTARLLGRAGIAITIGVLPAILLLGSAGLLLLPGIVIATLVRGADNSLRKSLHRSALEVLYVPVPAGLRRRTKTFIDSVADSAAEGIGAAIVFLVVTWGGLPSRWLAILVALLAGAFLWLARRAKRGYMATITTQLRRGSPEAADPLGDAAIVTGEWSFGDLRAAMAEVSSSVAAADTTADAGRVQAILEDLHTSPLRERGEGRGGARGGTGGRAARRHPGRSSARDARAEVESLMPEGPFDRARVAALTHLLARDPLYQEVTEILKEHEPEALDHLADVLSDPEAEFTVRRRIPAVLAEYRGVAADEALLAGLVAPRFEVRYRSAIALLRRRESGMATTPGAEARVWEAIRSELSRGRPVWELQRLLDDDVPDDDFVADRVETRGQLSLEHAFRLLSLVLDHEAVSSAYHGLLEGDARLRSLALEYLDQVLPEDVRHRLWPFIGDLSDYQRRKRSRSIDEVVSDLVTTSATLFISDRDRGALRKLLEEEGDA